MSKQFISDAVARYIANGGRITKCPDRVVLGSPQLDQRKLNARNFLRQEVTASQQIAA